MKESIRQQNLKNLGELIRIIIPAVAAVCLFIFSSFYLFLPRFEKSLLEDRKNTRKELVLSAWHLVQQLDKEVSTGRYSLKEAQTLAILLLRDMRYGTENKNYFWINDYTPTIIMHPYRPDMEGQDMSEYADSTGTMVFNEMVKKVKEQQQGYVDYKWQWMDDQSRIVPKQSFVKEYKPWGWIIGTGIYLEDVKLEIALMTKRIVITFAIILILVSLLAYYQIFQALNAMRRRQKAEAELIDYKDQLEIRVKTRTAQLTVANKALTDSEEKFRSLSEAAFEGIVIIDGLNIVEANKTIGKMLGYKPSELIGMEAIDLLPPEERERVKSKILSGYEQPYESSCLRKDGSTFPMEAHARMFSYKGQQVKVSAVRDLTEQKKAEEEIKTLRGIFPICASCKKIRDDKGYWNQIEAYIRDRSEAEFSHSICPECAKKLYPDLFDENGNLKKKK